MSCRILMSGLMRFKRKNATEFSTSVNVTELSSSN